MDKFERRHINLITSMSRRLKVARLIKGTKGTFGTWFHQRMLELKRKGIS